MILRHDMNISTALYIVTLLLGWSWNNVEGWVPVLPLATSQCRLGRTKLFQQHSENGVSRRQWMASLAAGTATLSVALPHQQTWAAEVLTTAASCDPSVTVWKRGNRVVYLLGTAHISQVSADLAGQLVRDIQPNGVFVELDLKRVGFGPSTNGKEFSPQITTNRLSMDLPPLAGESEDATTQGKGKLIVPIINPADLQQQSSSNPAPALLAPASTAPPKGIGLGQRMLNAGANAVGGAIKGMYKNLNQQGFQAGQEFVVAVREGQALGADVILGDQDVEVTLRRLTQALAVTDLNKLLDPDSDLEKSMAQLLPNNPTGGSGGSTTDPEAWKTELSTYVEAIKTRENVGRIMQQLREVAPALVQVMLTERDAYMAAGLNSLQDEEVIVAVMGIAHQQGVENNLREKGWQQAKLQCPRR